jgi:hypothetical protein
MSDSSSFLNYPAELHLPLPDGVAQLGACIAVGGYGLVLREDHSVLSDDGQVIATLPLVCRGGDVVSMRIESGRGHANRITISNGREVVVVNQGSDGIVHYICQPVLPHMTLSPTTGAR